MKDPHNTVERLTRALEAMATEVDASRRAQDIYEALAPLNSDEFPDKDAKLLFDRIISSGGSASTFTQQEYEQLFANVWDLYWSMSSNRQYK